MKNKEQLLKVISTCLYSWSSEAPAEAIWTLNDLLTFIELEFGFKAHTRFKEYHFDEDASENNSNLIDWLKENL